MHGGIEHTLDETDGLVALLFVLLPDRWKNQDIGIVEDPRSESEGKAVFVPVRLVFVLSNSIFIYPCVIYIVSTGVARRSDLINARASSRSGPVLDVQPFNAHKFPHIIRHQDTACRARLPRNHDVIATDGRPFCGQILFDPCGLFCRARVPWQNGREAGGKSIHHPRLVWRGFASGCAEQHFICVEAVADQGREGGRWVPATFLPKRFPAF